jgi:hypothetical protein
MIEAVREVTENAALRVNIWGGESVTQKASSSNNNRDPHPPDEEIWRGWKVAVNIRTGREDSCRKVGDSLPINTVVCCCITVGLTSTL